MNKIAAYEIALENIELEKRADYLVEAYGTCQGEMPGAYLQAFDRIEKEAGLAAIGKGITGGIYRAGKALGGTGASGARTGLGGKMMDFASRTGGKGNALGAQKLIGGAAVGTGGLAAFGAGRMSKS